MMLAFSPKTVRYVGRPLLPAVSTAAEPAAGYSFAFLFFLFLNFVLFVRPMELIPDEDFYGLEIYQYLIVVCLVLGFPTILAQLRIEALEKRPITLCMFGVLLSIGLCHLARFAIVPALKDFSDYFKVVLYFLLFNGLVTTPRRLRALLNVVLWSVVVVAAITVLEYHALISLPTVEVLRDVGERQLNGEDTFVLRLRGTGIFHDPNDLCVLLATAVLLALYRVTDRVWGFLRLFWLAPLALLLYAILLTHSRGGFLALLVGVSFFLVLRFGKRVGVVLALLLIPAVLIGLAGTRQTDFSTGAGTGRDRIELWVTGLYTMRQAPIFGIGIGEYVTFAGRVAHNSYLQAFVEMGLLGGTFFMGAAFLTMRNFYRLRRDGPIVLDPAHRQLVPFLGGACAAYCAGMMTLTLTLLTPTAMVLAIGGVMPSLTKTHPESPEERVDAGLLGRLIAIGFAFLAGMYLFVKMSLLRG